MVRLCACVMLARAVAAACGGAIEHAGAAGVEPARRPTHIVTSAFAHIRTPTVLALTQFSAHVQR